MARPGFSRYWIALAVLVVYLPALSVNFQHYDWTHRHISAGLNSLAAFGRLFTTPQADGMYRPLTFISLWADYRLFGDALWGYHLQSIALHALNTALVGVLAAALGMPRPAARLAALMFAVESVHFEAVLWPAARFDLLATTFALLSVIFFLRGSAALTVLSFAAAVLNKETAYSLVLILPVLRPRRKALLGAVLACAAALLAVRWWLYGGIGGYGAEHAAVSAKSFYLLAVNTLALSIFGINATVPGSVWAGVIVAAFLAVALFIAAVCAGDRGRRKWTLLVLAVLSALPALNVIGWIQPSMLHSRHLYWPSVWMTLLFVLLAGARCPRAVMAAFLAVQAAAAVYNISVQRNAIARAERIAERIQRDAAGIVSPRIALIGVPASPEGVMYFTSELETRIKQRTPGATVRFSSHDTDADVVYRWTTP